MIDTVMILVMRKLMPREVNDFFKSQVISCPQTWGEQAGLLASEGVLLYFQFHWDLPATGSELAMRA